VYLRGNQVRFIVLPDLLKNAPLFKCVARARSRRWWQAYLLRP